MAARQVPAPSLSLTARAPTPSHTQAPLYGVSVWCVKRCTCTQIRSWCTKRRTQYQIDRNEFAAALGHLGLRIDRQDVEVPPPPARRRCGHSPDHCGSHQCTCPPHARRRLPPRRAAEAAAALAGRATDR